MKELTVRRNDAGQRLDRFVGKAVPLLPETLLQKYIRIKRIKLNGKGAKRDTRLNEGDVLSLYINDEFPAVIFITQLSLLHALNGHPNHSGEICCCENTDAC